MQVKETCNQFVEYGAAPIVGKHLFYYVHFLICIVSFPHSSITVANSSIS